MLGGANGLQVALTPNTCDWSGCSEHATHRLEVSYADGRTDVRSLCRDHDDALKAMVRQEVGPKPVAPPQPPPAPTVACGKCGRSLDDQQSIPVEQRQPCPDCGSITRQFRVTVEDRIEMHESVTVTSARAGARKWFQRTVSGDSYTRGHEAWGERVLDINRESDSYREAMIFWSGATLESIAKLSDHGEPRRRAAS
jgi:hypothetical protein